jgi:hypothetical protein
MFLSSACQHSVLLCDSQAVSPRPARHYRISQPYAWIGTIIQGPTRCEGLVHEIPSSSQSRAGLGLNV